MYRNEECCVYVNAIAKMHGVEMYREFIHSVSIYERVQWESHWIMKEKVRRQVLCSQEVMVTFKYINE